MVLALSGPAVALPKNMCIWKRSSVLEGRIGWVGSVLSPLAQVQKSRPCHVVGFICFCINNMTTAHKLQSWTRMPFAALQGSCLRCAVDVDLDSWTKSSDFPGTETENWKNLHKGYFRICNFLSAAFYYSFVSVALAYMMLHSQCSNEEITAFLQLQHKLLTAHSPRMLRPNHRC